MTIPLIVLTGDPPWAADAAELLPRYELRREDEPVGYLERLADAHVALVLVDGDRPDGRFWVTTTKTEQATRRIPVLVVARDPAVIAAAPSAGAEAALSPGDLADRLPALVETHARDLPPALRAELDCQCQEPLPPLARLGVEKFNAGAYYAQHDALEALWLDDPRPVRVLYQGILQVGVAYYHIQRGNHRGALKMLLRSVQWLAVLPDVCQGVDVRQLREDAARARAALKALDPADIADFDRSLFKPVRLVDE